MSLAEFLKKRTTHSGFKSETKKDIIGLDLDIMKQDHANGVKIAEYCHVPEMREYFAWMRGHQNCWTGYPNDGKTTFVLFMMVTMSLEASWKWVIWSPEMKSANVVDGKVKVNYNTLAYEIMATLSGKTPYRHLAEKYKLPFLSFEEIQMYKEWIDQHFIFLDPEKKDIKSMYSLLSNIWEEYGFDGILIDPFKNLEKETTKREDQHLHDVFAEFKDFAIRTDTSMNWIAHPKSNVQRVSHEGKLNPCNQYMLAGGAAWDNSMDGIYSVLRPDALDNIESPRVTFFNLKQRMSELVAKRGEVEDIEFDIKTRKYQFKQESTQLY